MLKRPILVLSFISVILVNICNIFASEQDATNGYKAFDNAKITNLISDGNGKVAVRFVNVSNSSDCIWIVLENDGVRTTDAGYKTILATLYTAYTCGSTVQAIYWGTASGFSYTFDDNLTKGWRTITNKLKTIYVWQ